MDTETPPVATQAEEAISSTSVPIDDLRARITQWLHIPDEDAEIIDLILAVYASNRIPGDPLWGLVVDASGGGKTELLRSLRGRSDTYFLSKLTDKSLKSGYRDPKRPTADPSLLPKLDGKILVIKDLSPLLSMRRESRNTIVSDLRDAYDGFSDDAFGNVGRISYESRFSLVAASTLAIEQFSAVHQELGERFIKIRARGNENRAKVRRAIRNVGQDNSQRDDIRKAINEFLDQLPAYAIEGIPQELQEPLSVLADFIATARSGVARDRNHDLCYMPRSEVGTRLGKELGKLLLGLAYVRSKNVPDQQDLKTVCRVAEDCLPPNRFLVLRSIIAGQPCGLPESTAQHAREELQILGILNGKFELIDDWKDALKNVPQLFL